MLMARKRIKGTGSKTWTTINHGSQTMKKIQITAYVNARSLLVLS
jgi:hypothetical protein